MSAPNLFQQFAEELTQRLLRPLPGALAHDRMAPPMRRSFRMDPDTIAKSSEAAVLALFFPAESTSDTAELLLTVRPEGMSNHGGQVAFPGGRRESNESLQETALRETEEEVFIQASIIRIAGALTPLYIPPSNFYVHPFVGFLDHRPDLSVTSEEIARCFGVPVSRLIDPDVSRITPQKWNGEFHDLPYFALGGEFVWGATAMILAELTDSLPVRST